MTQTDEADRCIQNEPLLQFSTKTQSIDDHWLQSLSVKHRIQLISRPVLLLKKIRKIILETE